MCVDMLKSKGTESASLIGSVDGNELVRSQLKMHGDDGSTARHVIHYAYPAAADHISKSTQIDERLRTLGFKVKRAGSKGGVFFENYQSINCTEFDELTSDLRELFVQNGWKYEGWECALMAKPSASME